MATLHQHFSSLRFGGIRLCTALQHFSQVVVCAELWFWMDISKSIFLFVLVKGSFANPGCAVL